MSAQARGYDQILELGAGNGAITRRLAGDHGQDRLTLFELDKSMAQGLARDFPDTVVHEGCLHERFDVLRSASESCVAVSSLPFRSLPDQVFAVTREVVEEFVAASPKRKLVQFTYGLRAPFEPRLGELTWTHRGRVWSNMPPASVWTLQQQRC